MRSEAYRRDRERIEAFVQAWQEPLGLAGWRIDRHYYPSTEAFRKGTGIEDDDAFMSAHPDWEYLQGTIHVDCSVTATMGDWQVEGAVVHELVHHFLEELAPLVKMTPDVCRHFEHVTSSLSLAFMWVRDRAAKKRDPLPAECCKGECAKEQS